MDALPDNHYCRIAQGHEYHGPYHDFEYGFSVDSDDVLFERLMLEINQAGLSWLTILKKRNGLRTAYHGFSIKRVAEYGGEDRERLMQDTQGIRNALKIDAAWLANEQNVPHHGGGYEGRSVRADRRHRELDLATARPPRRHETPRTGEGCMLTLRSPMPASMEFPLRKRKK